MLREDKEGRNRNNGTCLAAVSGVLAAGRSQEVGLSDGGLAAQGTGWGCSRRQLLSESFAQSATIYQMHVWAKSTSDGPDRCEELCGQVRPLVSSPVILQAL